MRSKNACSRLTACKLSLLAKLTQDVRLLKWLIAVDFEEFEDLLRKKLDEHQSQLI
jgi:hypothetical protein